MRFRNRRDAGRRLAERLLAHRGEGPIVIALPRGGVPVGYEIARALRAPLDVLVVRKLGVPGRPELGMGALAPDLGAGEAASGSGGTRVLSQRTVELLGVTDAQLEAITAAELRELARRLRRYRGDRPWPRLTGRTVIVVDDGVATGVSTRAAVNAVRRREPAELVLAVPVCAPRAAAALRELVDELVTLHEPERFTAVGRWYVDFGQTSDEEVEALLERARAELRE